MILPDHPELSKRVTAGLPSVDPHFRYLRERMASSLNHQEQVQAECRRKAQAAIAKDGSIDKTKRAAADGIVLTGDIIVKRLTQMCPSLFFERSQAMPTEMGVYRLTDDAEYPKQYIGGFTYERCSEFLTIHTEERWVRDRKGVQHREEVCKGITPGWRELLWRLIKNRLITESQANAMFGPPSRESENWYLAMNL